MSCSKCELYPDICHGDKTDCVISLKNTISELTDKIEYQDAEYIKLTELKDELEKRHNRLKRRYKAIFKKYYSLQKGGKYEQ